MVRGIVSQTTLMCGLIVRQKHASYSCKQKRHCGASIDGFYDEYTFRLSRVNISGIANGVSVEFSESNNSLGPDVNLDFTAHDIP